MAVLQFALGRPSLAIALAVVCAATSVEACPAPPPAVADLDVPRFYGDAAGSRIDPAQMALNEAATRPLTEFLRFVTAESDKALKSAKPEARKEAAQCALVWLAAWAHGNAWLGKISTQQSEYARKWDLAGLSLAYFKVKSHASPVQSRVIEPWLDRFAVATRAFFDDPKHKRNNHWYWLGLALAGTGVAIDSQKHWAKARAIMRDAARDTRADGALPHEIARQGRAAHYHAFAVMPLVAMAEIAAARGEDWYAFGDGALHRLVALTVKGFADPVIFERLAGVAQQPVANSMGTGWLPLYAARFPQRAAGLLNGPLPAMRTVHRWTGGDVLLLTAEVQRKMQGKPSGG